MWGDTSVQQRGRYVYGYGRYKCPRCHRSVDKVWLEEQAKAALVPIFSDKKHLEAYLETEAAYRAALAQDADSRALERLAAEVGDRLASAKGSLLPYPALRCSRAPGDSG